MNVPTVSEVLNTKSFGAGTLVTESDVSSHCYACGATAPLSLARLVAKADSLFYRCGTCEEALVMVSPAPNDFPGTRGAIDLSGQWAIHPVVPLSMKGKFPFEVAGHG